MRTLTFAIERDPDTGHLVGCVPGRPEAHSGRGDIDALQQNLREVMAMLLEDGEPLLDSECVEVRAIQVAALVSAREALNGAAGR